MLEQLRAQACRATVGLFGETVERLPGLAKAVAGAGCEIAAMTWDKVDPWALPPGALRDQVEATQEVVAKLGLKAPTTFLPPFPRNQPLDLARESALREAGMRRTAGCRGEGLPAVLLASWGGFVLAGGFARVAPAWVLRGALAGQQECALALSPLDVDPGAPGSGWGRTAAMRRFPRLLRKGFTTAGEIG